MEQEFISKEELQKARQEIKTFEDLIGFLKKVESEYGNGYGVAPRAIAQGALAVAWYLCKCFGITSFQAGFVMWDFITDWSFSDNKCGLKIVDYDTMLYPQYEYKFQKTISRKVWVGLQKQAKENLSKIEYANPDVIKHWQSIVDGEVPFGYTVEEN